MLRITNRIGDSSVSSRCRTRRMVRPDASVGPESTAFVRRRSLRCCGELRRRSGSWHRLSDGLDVDRLNGALEQLVNSFVSHVADAWTFGKEPRWRKGRCALSLATRTWKCLQIAGRCAFRRSIGIELHGPCGWPM